MERKMERRIIIWFEVRPPQVRKKEGNTFLFSTKAAAPAGIKKKKRYTRKIILESPFLSPFRSQVRVSGLHFSAASSKLIGSSYAYHHGHSET